jgi:hypothetical protein
MMFAGISDQFGYGAWVVLLSFMVFGCSWWLALGLYADRHLSFRQVWIRTRRGDTRYILPLFHVCACGVGAAVCIEKVEKALFVLDFPISWIVELLFQAVRPLFSLAVLGTVWWYIVGREIRGIYGLIKPGAPESPP